MYSIKMKQSRALEIGHRGAPFGGFALLMILCMAASGCSNRIGTYSQVAVRDYVRCDAPSDADAVDAMTIAPHGIRCSKTGSWVTVDVVFRNVPDEALFSVGLFKGFTPHNQYDWVEIVDPDGRTNPFKEYEPEPGLHAHYNTSITGYTIPSGEDRNTVLVTMTLGVPFLYAIDEGTYRIRLIESGIYPALFKDVRNVRYVLDTSWHEFEISRTDVLSVWVTED